MLTVEGVDFGFGTRSVLRGLSLAAVPGEFLAIVGPNGCGKSTCLRLMAGLARPSAGRVMLDGQDIGTLNRAAIARRVALLPQSGSLPAGMIVRELVAMGRFAHQTLLSRRSAEDDDQIDRALTAMEVADLEAQPLGELSGGQLQRCRMAMVLAQNSATVLLDEPTTYLDLRHQYGILSRAKALATGGRTVIAVLHDLTHASLFADRVAVLHEGRLAALGPPPQVLTEALVDTVFGVRTRAVVAEGAVFHIPKVV